jgi:hypothetical protein
MEQTNRFPSLDTLCRFHLLAGLDLARLGQVTASLPIYTAGKDETIISRISTDPHSLYLLEGKLTLQGAGGSVSRIEAHTPSALNPIAYLLPRRYDVVASTEVEFLFRS